MSKQWWYSQEDERWHGPCPTRDDAIASGRGEYGGEEFMVMEAETSTIDFHIDVDTWLESLDDFNSDVLDPEGDYFVADRVSAIARRDIEATLRDVVDRWISKHNIDTVGYTFSQRGPKEWIAVDEEEEA